MVTFFEVETSDDVLHEEDLLGTSERIFDVGVLYQYPPTLRIKVPGMEKSNSRSTTSTVHSDDAYGHQPGEINYWMPLLRGGVADERNTLWC